MIRRNITDSVLKALRDTPIVYLQGARQTGKTWLARELARDHLHGQFLSFDQAAVLSAAKADPEGFLAGVSGPAVLDEVQRVGELLLAIKAAVDADRWPGRFLLTGSASVLAMPKACESLAGRMELHTLWPFSQGELADRREGFLDRLLAAKFDIPAAEPTTHAEWIERLLVGGYPEAVARSDVSRREAWFESYLSTILQRDIRDLANIERLAELPRLLMLLASRLGGHVHYSDLARTLTIPQTTVKRYLALLEATFLIYTLPAWFVNVGKRIAKSPKILLSDSGMACHLLGLHAERLAADRTLLGHMLENFTIMEIVKQQGWSAARTKLFHFRTEAGQEVDLVVENAEGNIAGVEIKAATTLGEKDFRGLKTLAEIAGQRFLRGVLLYLGSTVVPFGKNLHAVPLACALR